jgi:hypothetical protein
MGSVPQARPPALIYKPVILSRWTVDSCTVVQAYGTRRHRAGWPQRSTVAGAKKYKFNTKYNTNTYNAKYKPPSGVLWFPRRVGVAGLSSRPMTTSPSGARATRRSRTKSGQCLGRGSSRTSKGRTTRAACALTRPSPGRSTARAPCRTRSCRSTLRGVVQRCRIQSRIVRGICG